MEDDERDQLEAQRRLQELIDKVATNRADIDALQERADVDQMLIASLQADGILRRDQNAQLNAALHTSRKIGVAIGIIMVDRGLSESAAFDVLTQASQDVHRNVREVAEEIVAVGGLKGFHGR